MSETTKQWIKKLTTALASEKTDPEGCVKRLLALADRAHSAAKTSVGRWHYQQALEAAAHVLANAGKHDQAAQLFEELLSELELEHRYFEMTLVSTMEFAATELEQSGNVKKAITLRQQATDFCNGHERKYFLARMNEAAKAKKALISKRKLA